MLCDFCMTYIVFSVVELCFYMCFDFFFSYPCFFWPARFVFALLCVVFFVCLFLTFNDVMALGLSFMAFENKEAPAQVTCSMNRRLLSKPLEAHGSNELPQWKARVFLHPHERQQ